MPSKSLQPDVLTTLILEDYLILPELIEENSCLMWPKKDTVPLFIMPTRLFPTSDSLLTALYPDICHYEYKITLKEQEFCAESSDEIMFGDVVSEAIRLDDKHYEYQPGQIIGFVNHVENRGEKWIYIITKIKTN